MKAENKGLKPRQEAFAREFLIDLNGTAAAIRAGYSPHSARSIAQENLTKPDIVAKIQELMAARAERTDVTADMVVRELATIAFAKITDFVTWDAAGNLTILPVDKIKDAAGIARISNRDGAVSVTMQDKIRALIALGNHLDLFGKVRGRGINPDLPEAPPARKDDEKWPKRLITMVPDGDWLT